MPTKDELAQAINNLEAQEPTYETCLKLVVYHQLMDRYYKGGFRTSYSRDSEFMDAIKNTDIDTLLATVDELMDCLALINPKLYNTVLAKLRG